jgi:hypothetical protein
MSTTFGPSKTYFGGLGDPIQTGHPKLVVALPCAPETKEIENLDKIGPINLQDLFKWAGHTMFAADHSGVPELLSF